MSKMDIERSPGGGHWEKRMFILLLSPMDLFLAGAHLKLFYEGFFSLSSGYCELHSEHSTKNIRMFFDQTSAFSILYFHMINFSPWHIVTVLKD